MAWPRMHSRSILCAPMLTYLLEMVGLLCNPPTLLFWYETPKLLYLRGPLTIVEGLNILRNYTSLCVKLL